MKIKVWLDDIRPMPNGYDLHVQTAAEAIDILRTNTVECISLDHDLGEAVNGTGYDVAKFIEAGAIEGSVEKIDVLFHSANPVGVGNMRSAIKNALKAWLPQ